MKNLFMCLLGLSMFSSQLLAAEVCYELSDDGVLWSRTPELLCVNKGVNGAGSFDIQLKTGLGFNMETVAEFHFDLLYNNSTSGAHAKTYGLANPSNSVLNALQIEFDGKRYTQGYLEFGTVLIGTTKFFYRLR